MAGTAAAQPYLNSPSGSPSPPSGSSSSPSGSLSPPSDSPPQLTPPLPGELSETTALWLSLGGTAASWSLVVLGAELSHQDSRVAGDLATLGVLGTLVAPSFGH